MRTKTLLIAAALSAAGIATTMAQPVYSVNIVGYINKTLPPKFSAIANQLNASPDNKVQTLFGSPPGSVTVYKYNVAIHNFDQAAFDPDGGWSDPTGMVLNPGDAAIVDNGVLDTGGNPVSLTLTFVGEVKLSSTVNIHAGIDGASSVIPQSGLISALGFPTPDGIFTFYKYIPGTGYVHSDWDPDNAAWSPSEPSLDIAEGFFYDNGGGTLAWTRTFQVGQ